MSKENNLHDYFVDLYQGIASKKPNASKNPQHFRAEIEAIGNIGGINGVIEQYTVNAGATVTAGDFVEFVNEWNKGEIISTNPIAMSACKLDNTRVLVAYLYTDSSKYEHAYAVVVAVEDDTVVTGTPVIIGFRQYESLYYISADALTDSRAVVAVSNQSSGDAGWLALLSIEGLKIIIRSLEGNKYYYGPIHVTALTDKRFILAYRTRAAGSFTDTNSRLSYQVVKEDNSFSELAEYRLSTGSTNIITVYAVLKLNPTKAWVIQSQVANTYDLICYGFEDDNITVANRGINVVLNYNSSAALSETCVVTARNDGYAEAITIDGTNQTLGTSVALAPYTDASGNEMISPVDATSIVALNTNQALIAYRNKTDGKSYAVIATVNGTDITLGEPVRYTDYSDINQLIAFSDSSVVNIFANEFIAGVGMTIGDEDSYKGDWTLKERGYSGYENLNFTFKSNGEEFIGIKGSSTGQASANRTHLSYVCADGTTKMVWSETDGAYWTKADTKYQTITVTDEIDDTAQTWLGKSGEKKSPALTINQLTSTYVQPATSRLHNVGVARTAGTEGEKIDVYVVGEK